MCYRMLHTITMSAAEEKTHLREEMRNRIAAIPASMRAKEDASICQTLEKTIPVGSTIGGYMPLPDETDIRSFLHTFLKNKHAVYLPRYENATITFYRITSLRQLTMSHMGILEPEENARILEDGTPLTVLVPGRAFDAQGNRLGRGKGGYDAWITKEKDTGRPLHCIGIGYSCQLVDSVPQEPHDQRMDTVITDTNG